MTTLCIKVNADKIRMSHLLQMKKEFVDSAGSTKVLLEFLSSEQPVGKVHIDEKWGVEVSPQLKEKLNKLSPILSSEEV